MRTVVEEQVRCVVWTGEECCGGKDLGTPSLVGDDGDRLHAGVGGPTRARGDEGGSGRPAPAHPARRRDRALDEAQTADVAAAVLSPRMVEPDEPTTPLWRDT